MAGNKRASIQDFLFVAVAVCAFAVVTLLVFRINSEINSQFQASDDITSKGKQAMDNINDMYPGIIDNMFLILVIGLSIGALALASLVRIHPVFIALFLFILFIIIILAGVLSNIYQGIAENPSFTAQADQLIFMSHVMNFLPFIVGILGGILAIVMYKTWQQG